MPVSPSPRLPVSPSPYRHRVLIGACNPILCPLHVPVCRPAAIPAGDYVLGWRWDAEMTSQIWQSCSDITIA